MGRVSKANVTEVMRYHPPDEIATQQHQEIQIAAIAFAEAILQNTPESADQSTALRCVREAKMWANTAIALGGLV